MPHTSPQPAAPGHAARAAAVTAQPQRPLTEAHAEEQCAPSQPPAQTGTRPRRADEPDAQPHATGHVRPRDIAGTLRALRVLKILRARTDAHAGLSSTELVALLAHPEDPRLPAITTSPTSVRASIAALQAAGLDICASNKTGYALRTHPLADADAELIVGAICESATLSVEQRGRILDRVLGLASPTVRQRLLARSPARPSARPRSEVAGSSSAALSFAVRTAEELVRSAARQGLPCSFELAGADEPLGRRRRFIPTALIERDGVQFVTGTVIPAARDGSSSQRVFRLDRLRRLAAFESDGSLLVTPDTLQ